MNRLVPRTATLASRFVLPAPSSRSAFFRKWPSQAPVRNMRIQSFPMRVGSGDNYAYLIVDEKTRDAAIVDPAYPDEIVPILKKIIESGEANIKAIVNTHHHRDHAGGNAGIRDALDSPNLPIIGGRQCAGVTQTPAHGESWFLGDIRITAVHTPCHTQDSVCWFAEDKEAGQRAVFTGDTLFVGGCGRFFEGTAEEMHEALNVRLGGLPDDTVVYCGHEYTKNNINFTKSVFSSEAVEKLERYAAANRQTTGAFTIGEEKKHNVFMMVEDPELQKATGETDPVKVMGKLRSLKDAF